MIKMSHLYFYLLFNRFQIPMPLLKPNTHIAAYEYNVDAFKQNPVILVLEELCENIIARNPIYLSKYTFNEYYG